MRSRPSQSLETRDDEEVTEEEESGESESSTSSLFSDTDSGIWDGKQDQDDEGLDQNDDDEEGATTASSHSDPDSDSAIEGDDERDQEDDHDAADEVDGAEEAVDQSLQPQARHEKHRCKRLCAAIITLAYNRARGGPRQRHCRNVRYQGGEYCWIVQHQAQGQAGRRGRMEHGDEEEREEGEEQEAEQENTKPSDFGQKPSKCNISPDGDGRHATPLTTKPVGGAVSKEVRLLLRKRDKKHAISMKRSLAEANHYWQHSFDHLNRKVDRQNEELQALQRQMDRLTVKSAETKDEHKSNKPSSVDVSGSRTEPSIDVHTPTRGSLIDVSTPQTEESLIDWDGYPPHADDMNISSSPNTTINSGSDHDDVLFRESDEHGSGGYGKGEVVGDFLDGYYAAAAAPSTITKHTGNRDDEHGGDGRQPSSHRGCDEHGRKGHQAAAVVAIATRPPLMSTHHAETSSIAAPCVNHHGGRSNPAQERPEHQVAATVEVTNPSTASVNSQEDQSTEEKAAPSGNHDAGEQNSTRRPSLAPLAAAIAAVVVTDIPTPPGHSQGGHDSIMAALSDDHRDAQQSPLPPHKSSVPSPAAAPPGGVNTTVMTPQPEEEEQEEEQENSLSHHPHIRNGKGERRRQNDLKMREELRVRSESLGYDSAWLSLPPIPEI